MNTELRRRRVAHALWASGVQVDEVAKTEGVKPLTIRRWLMDPTFRALLAREAVEPILQTASAVLRWTPAAVARLVEDLDGESAADARQAAREILRMAIASRRDVLAEAAVRGTEPGADPLSRRVADLTDDQLGRVLAILNGAPDPAPAGAGGAAGAFDDDPDDTP